MSALLALRLVTYLLVGVGVVALLLAGLLDPLGGVILTLALIGSWAIDQVRDRMPVRSVFGWALVTTAAFAIGIDLLYLAKNLLDGMVHLLLFLILLRLFRRRSLKDLRDAGFLSFFMLVAASAVTFNVSFLFVFIAFLVLGTWMLILHHLVAESERARTGAEPAGGIGPRSPLFRMSLMAAAGTFALAGLMFFVIPRVGQATLPFRAELGRRISGFSERVELGAYGEIESDQTVVMRVRFPDGIKEPQLLPNLRWRGRAFDRFDGRVWEAGPRQRMLLRREPSGEFFLASPQGNGLIVRQEIFLDPIGADAVFVAPRALRLELGATAVAMDDMNSVVLPAVSTRLQYSADSELELTPPRGLRPSEWPVETVPRGLGRFLQLPPVPPRIRDLAREVTAGSRSPYEAALRLNQYLSSERFTYTLVLKRETSLDPLEEFLFVRRSGNCEYFAASLAVMLRSVGVPSRVVAGFQRGEWNPYGRYFMVRMKDAHSWVEAYFEGAGWVTLDPSPRAALDEVRPSIWSLYVDAVRMRWYRYVVNWSLKDQVGVAASMHRGASEWRGGPHGWLESARRLPRGVVAVAVVTLVVAGGWLWRRRSPGPAGRVAPASVPRFYTRALRALARRGYRRGPTETAREFSLRVEAAIPGAAAPVARLTAAYERCRFGAAALTDEEATALEASLAALRGR